MLCMLFRAYNIQVAERRLEHDEWLPAIRDQAVLLSEAIEISSLHVYEGIVMVKHNWCR